MSDTNTSRLTVSTTVNAPREQLWTLYTDPEHIVNWNAASPEWHTPHAQTDLKPGGRFNYRMEARDGSVGFDLAGHFDTVEKPKRVTYTFDDERTVEVTFEDSSGGTKVEQSFTPEPDKPADEQRAGWQSILDSFKTYAERQ